MTEFEGFVSRDNVEEVISDLETMAEEAPVVTAGAVYILKNELDRIEDPSTHRQLLFDREFILPGGFRNRLQGWFPDLAGLWKSISEWLTGRDSGSFRDRCDESFWRDLVPVIETHFGNLAEPIMNTVNEAIINYAEYSFRRWALWRRIAVHLFRTEEDLAYAIVRPLGSRLGSFDPLELKQKTADTVLDQRRGWGHTLLMQRALFISFDHAEKMRGMMIVVGPDEPVSTAIEGSRA
jgi:hypothetical protein